ncbi:GAF domain-containing protein [Pelistega europaea]|uniref:GAF domain-containing protein n=1 Tax=Pelistega europaea TaxID=106147 RepID=A0A7Y4P3P1_9BURK|nr:GAF domain-containing protein [Pelistega europaea]NOL48661.1 GAF domain-containing protein [Pelistega europaea]
MFEVKQADASLNKVETYQLLAEQLQALLSGEHNLIANAANMSALVYHQLPDLNWCGFYLFDGTELVLGPFQGKVACVRIALNRGVCGTAASTCQTQLVQDVHSFPGHIACDAASQSEIVVPLIKNGQLIGVWDVDSPKLARFDEEDRKGMQTLCEVFLASL